MGWDLHIGDYGSVAEAKQTDTKECYERAREGGGGGGEERRGTCFHFVSNVKSRAQGSKRGQRGSGDSKTLPLTTVTAPRLSARMSVHKTVKRFCLGAKRASF